MAVVGSPPTNTINPMPLTRDAGRMLLQFCNERCRVSRLLTPTKNADH